MEFIISTLSWFVSNVARIYNECSFLAMRKPDFQGCGSLLIAIEISRQKCGRYSSYSSNFPIINAIQYSSLK